MNDPDESITTADDTTPPRDRVGSLERGLAVMEILAANPGGLTLTEMAEKAELTRAGARRFLLTLVATGYATQSGRRFVLSSRLLTVTRSWLGGTSLWTFAEPHMRVVTAELKESCSAAILAGEDVVYVARVPGEHIIMVQLQVGTKLPAYCTSMGRILMAGLTPADRRALLARATIRANTPKTLTDRDAIGKAIERAGLDGYALVDEELEPGLRSIAVPIRDRTGAIVAAINLSSQSARSGVREMREKFLPPLKKAAARIEDFFTVA